MLLILFRKPKTKVAQLTPTLPYAFKHNIFAFIKALYVFTVLSFSLAHMCPGVL